MSKQDTCHSPAKLKLPYVLPLWFSLLGHSTFIFSCFPTAQCLTTIGTRHLSYFLSFPPSLAVYRFLSLFMLYQKKIIRIKSISNSVQLSLISVLSFLPPPPHPPFHSLLLSLHTLSHSSFLLSIPPYSVTPPFFYPSMPSLFTPIVVFIHLDYYLQTDHIPSLPLPSPSSLTPTPPPPPPAPPCHPRLYHYNNAS